MHLIRKYCELRQKESGRFDLPIAVGILVASGQLKAPALDAHEFAGELALGGELRAVRGALAMCLSAGNSQRAFVLPRQSAPEAALARSATVLPAATLLEVCAHLSGQQTIEPYRTDPAGDMSAYPDLAEVKGQAPAKRALEVAAAGAHSLLMSGPPGTGKSMLAARLPGILPPLTEAQALESAALLSLDGGFAPRMWRRTPMRSPHHSASSAALVGGGGVPRPGEISLAHNGVLFLDELPEFARSVLEALREPLESGRITISRAARRAEYPARFQFVAAMNPCPCGYAGETRCRCTPDQIARYRGKLSGPLLDRIDLAIDVPAVGDADLAAAGGEPSAAVRERTTRARAIQLERQGKPNAELTPEEIDRHCLPDCDGAQLLKRAMAQLAFSARAYHRVLKVARSIADLAGAAHVGGAHVAEAIQYRRGLAIR